MKRPRTTIVIAGQTLWPIRWRLVFSIAWIAVYDLGLLYLGLIALLALGAHSPDLSPAERQQIGATLARLRINSYWQATAPILVICGFVFERVVFLAHDILPEETR